jgi:hypothetical protein
MSKIKRYVFFFIYKICVIYDILCIICSKIKFIINIINVIRIYTFCFYNNKHTCVIIDTKFTIKHKYLIKINIVTGHLCDVNNFTYFRKQKSQREANK